jgi:tetrachlorobenzoquinone reductase
VHLHVDEEADGRLLDVGAIVSAAPSDADLYCCGPAPMLQAFEAASVGRPPGTVHVERFAAASVVSPAGADAAGIDAAGERRVEGDVAGALPPARFVVELARSGKRLPVAAGQSIAEALKAGGVAVTVSCEQGVCGTCETRVVAGLPDHRDALLSADEKAANDVMMICCSRSLTETLVLDL